jgi:integrase
MAWTERLSSGKHRGCWRDPDGRKHYTRRPEFPEHPYRRKRDALEAAQEAEVRARRKAAAAQGVVSATITFGEWWETAAPAPGDSQTAANAASIGRLYLLPKWGETPLNQIAQRAVKAWVADLIGKGLDPSYVQRIFAEFRRAINLALESDPPVLEASPCAGVRLPTVRRKHKTFLEPDWIDSVRHGRPATPGRRATPGLHPNYIDLTRVALLTGMRPGELCGVHADAVDLDQGWVTVRSVYVDRRHVIRGYPKDRDVRRVPLVDEAVDIVRRRLAGRDLAAGCGVRHADGSRCGGALVFLSPTGRPVTPDAWKISMYNVADRLGVVRRSPYDCRRGFATLAARGGMDAFELAEIMGHADIRQTREYVQQSPAARDRLRVALGGVPRLRAVGS